MGRVGRCLLIAVIGATGHIGNTLARELELQGEKIVGIIPKGEDETALKDVDLSVRYADIRSFSSILKAIDGCDVVYHTAGIVSIHSGEWKKLSM